LYLLPKISDEDELTLLDGTPEEIEKWLFKQDSEGSEKASLTEGSGGFQEHMQQNGFDLPSFHEGDEKDEVLEA
jgi:hypothetical protein